MNIVARAEKFVREFLSENLPEEMHFHNEGHALDVANAVNEIGIASSVGDVSMEVVEVAAWFHDTGYCFEYGGHENSSIDIADKFLSSEKCSTSFINEVLTCIRATRFPQTPDTLLEQIICDADLYHLSKKNYFEYATRLRTEWSLVLHKTFTDRDWHLQNLQLLCEHRYHTGYGQQILERRKQRNIEILESVTG
jgi:uncharacterized protein